MIKIKLAIEQPIEDENHWSYPFSELDYLFETEHDDTTFLLYNGRLYETDEDTELQKLHEAKNIICKYCRSDMCEWCKVENMVTDAENGTLFNNDDEYYIPSSTNRDYGPSNPWDAPGMRVSDFI